MSLDLYPIKEPITNLHEYKESIRDSRTVYYRGKKVNDVTEHPILRLGINQGAYFLGENIEDEKLKERLYYYDSELKAKISSFYKVPQSSSDLYERFRLTYDLTKASGGLMPHIGSDALNAARIVSGDLDKKYKDNFTNYAQYVSRNNLFLAGAQIDVKGNRSVRPSEQEDPDLYVHVTDENKNGVVVRGAKIHTSASMIANEIFVFPGRALQANEGEYAIAFAVPVNTKGLRLICRPAIGTEAAQNDMEGVRVRRIAFVDSLTIFDNVFVPWERVFIYKDPMRAGKLALMFALWHRFSAVSYRAALAEYFVGLGKLIAEANGVDRAPHIQKDVVDLLSFTEIQKICAKIAAYECIKDENTGIAIPNPIYTNIGKLYSNDNYLNTMRSLIDIAGGLAITAPSADDYYDETLRKDIDKYLSAAIPGNDRFKLFLLLRETIVLMGGEEEVMHMHAEGSARASLMELYRTYDFDGPESLVNQLLLRMRGEDRVADYSQGS